MGETRGGHRVILGVSGADWHQWGVPGGIFVVPEGNLGSLGAIWGSLGVIWSFLGSV